MSESWSLGSGSRGLVTVIVTAYNQGWVLAETLGSVAAQTYRPIECVVVDDGSTDNTPAVVKNFEKRQGKGLSIINHHQSNQGAQAARNAGVQASSGEFIQFLDGDDLLGPSKLQVQVQFLSADGAAEYGVVYGDAKWLHDDGRHVEIGENVGVGPTADILASLLDFGKFNPPFSYLSRRAAVEQCGPWDARLKINDDAEYFLRMACCSAEHGRTFGYVPVMTGLYRQHPRPRTSVQAMTTRVQYTLLILELIEARMNAAGLLTIERRRALARGYRRVAYWASLVDKVRWKESLGHSIRLDSELMPERFVSKYLQRALGVWTSERLLRRVRQVRQRLGMIADH